MLSGAIATLVGARDDTCRCELDTCQCDSDTCRCEDDTCRCEGRPLSVRLTIRVGARPSCELRRSLALEKRIPVEETDTIRLTAREGMRICDPSVTRPATPSQRGPGAGTGFAEQCE